MGSSHFIPPESVSCTDSVLLSCSARRSFQLFPPGPHVLNDIGALVSSHSPEQKENLVTDNSFSHPALFCSSTVFPSCHYLAVYETQVRVCSERVVKHVGFQRRDALSVSSCITSLFVLMWMLFSQKCFNLTQQRSSVCGNAASVNFLPSFSQHKITAAVSLGL